MMKSVMKIMLDDGAKMPKRHTQQMLDMTSVPRLM